MNVKMRQAIEKEIAARTVQCLLKAGFVLSVAIEPVNSADPADHEIWKSNDAVAVVAAMFAGDEDWLKVYEADSSPRSLPMGWVRFIYGNDGWDVISDYTTNLETHLAKPNKLAELIDSDPALIFKGRDAVWAEVEKAVTA